MANNFDLGTAWIQLRAKDIVPDDIKKMSGNWHHSLRAARQFGHAATGGAGAAGIGALMGPTGAAVGEVIDLIAGGFNKLASFVGKANPQALERYNKAWDDLQASIGHDFQPVLSAATESVKLLGDAIKTLADASPAIQNTKSYFQDLSDVLKEYREDLERSGRLKSVAGSAYSGPAKMSSLSEYLKSANLAAFSGGDGGPATRTASATEKLVNQMDNLLQYYGAQGEWMRQMMHLAGNVQ